MITTDQFRKMLGNIAKKNLQKLADEQNYETKILTKDVGSKKWKSKAWIRKHK